MAHITSSWLDERLSEALSTNKRAERIYRFLMEDVEFIETYKMANKVAVGRLGYNDHGITHIKIVTLNAIKICRLLQAGGIKPNVVKENSGTQEDAEVVVMLGALFHDVGNSVHRINHETNGVILANSMLRHILPKFYGEREAHGVRMAALECIFSSYEKAPCISIESSIVSVADGTDCVKGRARVPYKVFGKQDIHAVSALAITDVWLGKGKGRPVMIRIDMSNPAGIFQVQEVLSKKMEHSLIKDYIELDLRVKGKRLDATDLSAI